MTESFVGTKKLVIQFTHTRVFNENIYKGTNLPLLTIYIQNNNNNNLFLFCVLERALATRELSHMFCKFMEWQTNNK